MSWWTMVFPITLTCENNKVTVAGQRGPGWRPSRATMQVRGENESRCLVQRAFQPTQKVSSKLTRHVVPHQPATGCQKDPPQTTIVRATRLLAHPFGTSLGLHCSPEPASRSICKRSAENSVGVSARHRKRSSIAAQTRGLGGLDAPRSENITLAR